MDLEEFNQAAPWEPGSQTIWKYHLIEVLVFLFLIVPSMAFSFAAKATMGAMGFTSLAGALIIQDLSLLTLVLYFIWRNGEHLRDLGWTWKNCWSDVFLGLILFVPFTYVAKILENVLHHAGLTAPSGHSAALTAPEKLRWGWCWSSLWPWLRRPFFGATSCCVSRAPIWARW